MRINKIMPYAFPVIVIGLCVFYYFVNPFFETFPIKCIWHEITGTQCPACGFQRFFYALLHGNFLEALSYNYFLVVLLPYAILAILASWYNFNHVFDKLSVLVYHRYTLKAYVYLFFIWWVVRNFLKI